MGNYIFKRQSRRARGLMKIMVALTGSLCLLGTLAVTDLLGDDRYNDRRSTKVQQSMERSFANKESLLLKTILKQGQSGDSWFFEVGTYSTASERRAAARRGVPPKVERELRKLSPEEGNKIYLSSVDHSGIVETIELRCGTDSLRFCAFGATEMPLAEAIYVHDLDEADRPCYSLRSARTYS